MVLYNRDKDDLIPYSEDPVSKEEKLEDFIEKNPKILDKDLMIIARQKSTPNGRIDLMGLDKNGNTVIIELKKDIATREVVAQILDYAVWSEDLKYEDLNSIYKENISSNSKKITLMEKFKVWAGNIDPDFNENQRLYIIGGKIDPKTEKFVRYLQKREMDISCIEITFHKLNDHEIVDKREIVVKDNTSKSRSNIIKTVEDHLNRGNPTVRELYKLLESKIKKLKEGIEPTPVQSYIGFKKDEKVFASVKIKQEFIKIGLQFAKNFDDPKKLTIAYPSKDSLYHVKLENEKELNDIMNLVEQAYNSN